MGVIAMSSAKRVPKLEATAYHEAGHAYLAVERRLPFHHVTIDPSDDYLGHLLRKAWPESFQPDIESTVRTTNRLDAYLFMVQAGRIAEYVRTGRFNNVGARQDAENAVSLGLYLHHDPDVLSAYLQYVDVALKAMLRCPHHWMSVDAIAKALLKSTTLKAAEVRRIVKNAMESELKSRLGDRYLSPTERRQPQQLRKGRRRQLA
jgi:ATP-dependent Zn protease